MKTSITLVLTTIITAATLALGGNPGIDSRPQRPPREAPSPRRPETAAASTSTASSTPSSNSSTASSVAGLRGYRRYHTNGSYIGTSIPCSYEEKLCLRYNVLFDPSKGRCLPKPDDMCVFVADRAQFTNGSGHLYAVCPGYKDPCPGHRMAFDGRCYTESVVRDVICGCDDPPIPHFLGGVECRCGPVAEVRVEQPAQDGRCRVPDLRFPDNKRAFLYRNPNPIRIGALNCSRQQAACFSQGKVMLRGNASCFRIGERGPCATDHVVALDRRVALSRKRAEATCVHVRGGCPAGERRLAFDRQCHKDLDIRVLSYGNIDFTVDGRYIVKFYGDASYFFLNTTVGNNRSNRECVVHYINSGALGPQHYSHPHCSANNRGLCALYEVETNPPDPFLDEE